MTVRTTRGVTRLEFRALASLFMSDDDADKVLDAADDELIRDWLDAQARQLGYDSWVVAYHEIGGGS